jgi:hypothetical protein
MVLLILNVFDDCMFAMQFVIVIKVCVCWQVIIGASNMQLQLFYVESMLCFFFDLAHGSALIRKSQKIIVYELYVYICAHFWCKFWMIWTCIFLISNINYKWCKCQGECDSNIFINYYASTIFFSLVKKNIYINIIIFLEWKMRLLWLHWMKCLFAMDVNRLIHKSLC